MILRQFLHQEPVGISYLFGCGGRAAGAVVDPVGDIEPYLRAADAAGMRIHFVIDTHLHADHLSAGRQLAKAAGAEYVLGARAEVSFPFRGAQDEEVLPLGNVAAKVLHTPGHTPEHICILVTDRTRADEPWFALTGHTLMVGDLGRTELAVSAEQGATDLFQSVRRLKALPDYVEVLPGAYAGSVCGRRLSGRGRPLALRNATTRPSRSASKLTSFASCSPRFRQPHPRRPRCAPPTPAQPRRRPEP